MRHLMHPSSAQAPGAWRLEVLSRRGRCLVQDYSLMFLRRQAIVELEVKTDHAVLSAIQRLELSCPLPT
jgi:hypothetical protein